MYAEAIDRHISGACLLRFLVCAQRAGNPHPIGRPCEIESHIAPSVTRRCGLNFDSKAVCRVKHHVALASWCNVSCTELILVEVDGRVKNGLRHANGRWSGAAQGSYIDVEHCAC